MECNGVLNFLYKTNFRKTQMLYLNYWYEIKNVEEKCQIRYRIGRNATPKLQNLLKKQQNLPPPTFKLNTYICTQNLIILHHLMIKII